MISAPRSASTWVPNGPAPNWETARTRTPSSGGLAMSVGKLARAEGGVVLLRLAQLEDAALRVQGVADEGGLLVLEGVHLEVGDGASGDVRHRHAYDHAVDERAQDHALLVLRVGLGVVGVGVERVLVHG